MLRFSTLFVTTMLLGSPPISPTRVEAGSAAGPSPSPGVAMVRARGADGLFRVPASRAGRAIRLVVDTGATLTVLSMADARSLAIDVDRGETSEMATAGGIVAVRYVTLDGLNVAGQKIPPLYVAVATNGFAHSLLGQDALAQMGRITFDGDRIMLGGAARD